MSLFFLVLLLLDCVRGQESIVIRQVVMVKQWLTITED